jgi:hypothetical protein
LLLFLKLFTHPQDAFKGNTSNVNWKDAALPHRYVRAVTFCSSAPAAVNQRNIQQFTMLYISQSLPPLFTCSFPLLNCRLFVNNHVVLLNIFFSDRVGCSRLFQIWQQTATDHQHCWTVYFSLWVIYGTQFCYNVLVLVKNYVIIFLQSNFQSEQVSMSYWVTSGQEYY